MPILNLRDRARRDAVALITAAGQRLTYRDLGRITDGSRRVFECPDKALVAVFGDRDTDTVTAYLASLSLGHACGLFGAVPAAAQAALVGAYQPEFVVGASPEGYAAAGALPGGTVVSRRTRVSEGSVFADLALLLATSGSTGSPKVVRLSLANLDANAPRSPARSASARPSGPSPLSRSATATACPC